MRILFTIFALFGLWLLLSGIYKPMVVWLGLASCVFSVFITRRMDDAADADRLEIRLRPFHFVAYIFWLFIEIARANWVVTKTIFTPKININQKMFKVPFTQKTELGQTIFANSITLTPGTISVEVEKDYFLVHALSYSKSDLVAIADMDMRVSKTESVI